MRRPLNASAIAELSSNDANSHDIFPGARHLAEVREHDDLVLAPSPEKVRAACERMARETMAKIKKGSR